MSDNKEQNKIAALCAVATVASIGLAITAPNPVTIISTAMMATNTGMLAKGKMKE